jgi:hypothetical protein
MLMTAARTLEDHERIKKIEDELTNVIEDFDRAFNDEALLNAITTSYCRD